jgi:hypothetical protein
MRRTAIVVIVGAVSLLGAAALSAAALDGAPAAAHRPAADRIPLSVTSANLLQRKGIPSHVVRRGSVGSVKARRLAHDIDRLKAIPKGETFACPADRGARRNVSFRHDGRAWNVSLGSCGSLVTITPDQQPGRLFHNSARYARDLRRDFRAMRPVAEWVPRSVHRARIAYRKQSFSRVTKRRTVRGSRAAALVTAFDRLPLQPRHVVSCNVAGGPSETVTFGTAHHHWTSMQSTCTGVEVARDHTKLPTLSPDQRWDRAVRRALR